MSAPLLLIEVAVVAPAVRFVIYAAPVLIEVVDNPFDRSDKPPTFKPPVVIATFA